MKFLKFIHRWFGVVAALFIIMFAISGIVLNHRHFFSPVSVNRNMLPKDYQFGNWNLAAAKGATYIGIDSLLIYGNIGVWLTDPAFSYFEPFNTGFLKGIDNRKTFHVFQSPKGNTYAGTLSGLYFLEADKWEKLSLPVKETLVRAIEAKGDSLLVLTRSHLIIGSDSPGNNRFEAKTLPHPKGYDGRTSLFRAFWVLHSGEIFGIPGKIIVDLMGLIMIFLSITGIVWFVAPDMMKALGKRISVRKKMARLNRFSLKWHNLIGIWVAGFLLINTVAGAFLRPPLLIAIVRSDIANIKGTILDHANPWNDKLRDIRFDERTAQLLISTSDGFFAANQELNDSLMPIQGQPPVSVMGINVFEPTAEGDYVVGSFSGLFLWNPLTGQVFDKVTGLPHSPSQGMANPFGSIPVAGYIKTNSGKEYIFDYNAGVFSKNPGQSFPQMPEVVKKATPFPLYNLALEIHVGRFYSFIFGKFHILFIPLAALVVVSILISGVILWIRINGRKRRQKKNCNPKIK